MAEENKVPVFLPEFNVAELEMRLLATVPEGYTPQEWFREQYLCRPVSFEPQK